MQRSLLARGRQARIRGQCTVCHRVHGHHLTLHFDHHVVCLCDEPDLGPGWCHRCHRLHPSQIVDETVGWEAWKWRQVWRAELAAVRDGHPVMAPTAHTPPPVGATHDREPA